MGPEDWTAARLPTEVVHLDVAACGRVSTAAMDAQVAHLRREAEVGGYVAEAEAAPALDAGRAALAGLVGLAGEDVAFSESAAEGFAALMAAWPLPPGARVGVLTSDYGGNALALARLAAERGWELVRLPVDDLGRLQDVPAGLDLVTFPQVASQRGVAQPVHAVLDAGVPLVLDVAQSLGQVPVPGGCAAYVGTSRKWLCGPRGVGLTVVDPRVEPSLTRPPTLAPGTGARRLEAHEAHVAGRVGLAVAAVEWDPSLVGVALARARYARTVLADRGWRVVEPVDEPTAITTLEGPDPVPVRAALRERGLLVSAVPLGRSPDLLRPVLRVATAAWVTEADLDALADALDEVAA